MGYAIRKENDNKITYLKLVEKKEKPKTKDGIDKKTPNNVSHEQFVEPIRSKTDIQKIMLLLNQNIQFASTPKTRQKATQNKMLFLFGISVGLRVNDLLELRFCDIFESDMKTIRTTFARHKEAKTGKLKTVIVTNAMKDAINEYVSTLTYVVKPDQYLFSKSNDQYKHICDETVSQLIKKLTSECKIAGKYSTHSLRKTCAYQMYMTYTNNGDPLALPKVQKFLNHFNQSDTLRYLGLDQQLDANVLNAMYNDIY